MRTLRAFAPPLAAALALASCSSTGSSSDAGEEPVIIDDGRPASGDDGSLGCVLDGYPCADASPCCAGVCTAGFCGEGGTCLPKGTPCSSANVCCSHACAASQCQ
jgi:hypothetical protein